MSKRLRTVAALLAAAVGISGCVDEVNIAICSIVEVKPGSATTVIEGETAIITLEFVPSAGCDDVAVTAVSADPTTVSVGAATIRTVGTASEFRSLDRAEVPVNGVKVGGPVNVRLTVTAVGTPSQEGTVPVTVTTSKGTINVTITGLPAGVDGDVFVGSVLIDGRKFTASGSGAFRYGTITVIASSVTANGVTYDPTPTSTIIDLPTGGTRSVSVAYSPRVASTGTANIQVGGLPAGTPANVTVTGNGVNQTVTQTGNVTLAPGTYTVTANQVATTNNDYADPTPSRQVTITAGQTTNVLFAYAIIATLVNLNVTGLEAGLAPMITLTRGGETRTVTANTAALRLALGAWTIAVVERTQSIRSYRGRTATPATLTVLAQTSPMALALAYYCYRFQWQAVATFAVLLDPNGHNPFVALQLAAHLLGVTWLFPEPLSSVVEQGGTANQTVTQETVTITGQGSFVTVTGTRAANGALTLTGTGTVAGFSNVPVRMTGTLSGTGAFSNIQYEMGQNTAPTGLPGGSIVYSMSAPAPSAAGAVLMEALRPPR